nr:hypothetical protein [uncultured Acetatifactor sp.]
MAGQEKMQVIERVKNMSDNEINMLEIFMEGFLSGVRTAKDEMEKQQSSEQSKQTV